MKRSGRLRTASKKAHRVTERQLLKLWGKVIVARDPICRCGCGKPSQVGHHVFKRSTNPKLRFRLENGIGLTHGCHKFKAHQVLDYRAWHEAIIGPEAWLKLEVLDDFLRSFSQKLDREATRIFLEQELKRYE